MKTLLLTIRNFSSARAFLLFSILFYLSMYVSKTVHALWFDEQGALPFFGISYTMMAIAGALSFITGKIGDIISPSFALKLGVFIYSIGLILRIFTNSLLISGISGFIAGIGASLVIVSMRYWILSIGNENDRSAMVSLKETSSEIGTAIGTAIAGVSVVVLGFITDSPLRLVLILSAILCLLTVFFVPKFKENNTEKDTSEEGKAKVPRTLIIGVIWFGIIGGLIVSMLVPYIPIILKNQGVPISLIGIFITIMSLCSILFSTLFSNKKVNENKAKIFFISEIAVALFTIVFIFDIAVYLIPLILIFRTFFNNGSVICQELLELDMYPKAALGLLFGLSQSAFFIGDALGGSIGGFLFNLNQNYAIILSVGLTLINATMFPLFFRYITRTKKPRGGNYEPISSQS